MTSFGTMQLGVAADSLDKAEEGLDDLPLTPRVRELQKWRLALLTVLHGIMRDVPRITDDQRDEVITRVEALAAEVADIRRELRVMVEQETLPPSRG